jgi:archaellum biogenesis ATPase FlaH
MTGVQIAIEKSEKQLLGEKIILFDSINALTIYQKKENIAKFFHMFNNKVRLEGKTAVIFAVKDSTDPELIEYLKEFADKTFDYSDLFISAIAMAQQ